MSSLENGRIAERLLQKCWEDLPLKRDYFTECNRLLRVRSTGYRNREAGPDFRNAGIAIDGKTLVGDIEIHVRASDWFAHGHHHDPGYQQVILHVVAKNDLPQDKREQLPPMLVLKDGKRRLNDLYRKPDDTRGRCATIFSHLGVEQSRRLLIEAGLVRFRRKCTTLLEQMLLSGAEAGFWRCLFEAAGYKQNRSGFRELFERLSTYPDDLLKKHLPAVLWGESGLLPEPAAMENSPLMRDFVKTQWEQWWSIRHEAHPAIRWRRSGVRPVNSPTRRLAVLLHYHERFGRHPLKYIHERLQQDRLSPSELLKLFQVNCEFWNQYADFAAKLKSPAAIGGYGFALELLANIVLPAIHAAAKLGYFENSDSIAVMEQAERYWLELPPTQENTVTRKAASLWFSDIEWKASAFDSAAARQGMLHFWREYCEPCQSDCSSCRFFNSFSQPSHRV